MPLSFALRAARLAAGLAVLFLSLAANPLRADVIYNFSGTCNDCTGTASATLVLKNYTPGTTLDPTNLVSFVYDGTDLLVAYQIDIADSLTGVLPVTSGPADFDLVGTANPVGCGNCLGFSQTFEFGTLASDGSWFTGPLIQNLDAGTSNNFSISSVPEPSSILLISAGVAGLAVLRRRKVQ